MTESAQLKSCCATAYESDFARLLLGNSFHPGGLALTERLGHLLKLSPADQVLDVAAGKGESIAHLAKIFGCTVTGVDLNASAAVIQGDAEHLPFPDASFDALICECAFCTFPDKSSAAAEFFRVLRPGGRIGLSDLTRSGPLPADLEGLLAWIACIADARPVSEYAAYLQAAGFAPANIEPHNDALRQMVRDIESRLLGAELMTKLKKLDLPGADFDQAKALARAASSAVRADLLGYTLIIAEKA